MRWHPVDSSGSWLRAPLRITKKTLPRPYRPSNPLSTSLFIRSSRKSKYLTSSNYSAEATRFCVRWRRESDIALGGIHACASELRNVGGSVRCVGFSLTTLTRSELRNNNELPHTTTQQLGTQGRNNECILTTRYRRQPSKLHRSAGPHLGKTTTVIEHGLLQLRAHGISSHTLAINH